MNKSKPGCEKYIVRNTEDVIPKTVVIPLPEEKKDTDTNIAEPPKEKISHPKVADISAPKLNSTLCVKKKIKKVEETKPRKIKSLSDLPKSDRLTVDEKITKQVNFPFDKHLYKELISLQLVDKPVVQSVPITHEPVVKDRVPKLEDFYMPTWKGEYSVPVNTTINTQPVVRQYNGFRLQQVIKSWQSDRPD